MPAQVPLTSPDVFASLAIAFPGIRPDSESERVSLHCLLLRSWLKTILKKTWG